MWRRRLPGTTSSRAGSITSLPAGPNDVRAPRCRQIGMKGVTCKPILTWPLAVAKGDFVSGYHHYLRAGRVEARPGGFLPQDWDEEGYLQAHPDVAAAVAKGSYVRGYNHYLAAGRAEGRLGGFQPKDWDEAGYLAANPDARIRLRLASIETASSTMPPLGDTSGSSAVSRRPTRSKNYGCVGPASTRRFFISASLRTSLSR